MEDILHAVIAVATAVTAVMAYLNRRHIKRIRRQLEADARLRAAQDNR